MTPSATSLEPSRHFPPSTAEKAVKEILEWVLIIIRLLLLTTASAGVRGSLYHRHIHNAGL